MQITIILPHFFEAGTPQRQPGRPRQYPVILAGSCIGRWPVASPSLPWMSEIVKNGIFMPQRSPEALAKAIVGLLLSDKKKLDRLGEHSRETAEKYGWERIVDRIEGVYERLF